MYLETESTKYRVLTSELLIVVFCRAHVHITGINYFKDTSLSQALHSFRVLVAGDKRKLVLLCYLRII